MAVQTPATSSSRHVFGDSVMRYYSFTSVANGDTFTPPQTDIEFVIVNPGTAVAAGSTISANGVITFVLGGTGAIAVQVFSRVG
jgi:hypothetical protein